MDHEGLRVGFGGILARGRDGRLRLRFGIDDEDMGVMDDFAVPCPQFRGDHPSVLGESGRDGEIDVLIGPRAFELLLRNFHDCVGLADVPAVICEVRGGRQILRIAFETAGIGPLAQGGDLGIGEARIIRPLAVMRIGLPWRHLARDDGFLDRGGPGLCVVVCDQRPGRDIVRVMAAGAMFVENRSDVARKRGFGAGGASDERAEQGNTQEPHGDSSLYRYSGSVIRLSRRECLATLATAVAARGQTVLPEKEPEPEDYACPMDRDYRSSKPGVCPRCGMKLVLKLPESVEYRLEVTHRPEVLLPGQPAVLTFRALHPITGKPASKFLIVHEKLMHLFVVSENLEVFMHVHPV